jgi:hypothetical protein
MEATTIPPAVRPMDITEIQKLVEVMQLPAEGRATSAWIKRPDGWSTLVVHVPAKHSKVRGALAIQILSADLVAGS